MHEVALWGGGRRLQVQVHIFEAVRGRLPTPSAPCADGSARTLCLRNPATDLSGTCGWFGPESVVALVMDSSQMHGPGSGSHTPGGTPQAGYGASASGTPAHGITSSVTVQQEPGRTNQAVCERYAPQQNQHAIQQQAGQDGAAAMASSGGFQLPMPSPPPPYVSLTGTPQQSCGAYIPFAPCGQSSTQAASQPSHDDVQLPGWQPLTPQSGGSFAGTFHAAAAADRSVRRRDGRTGRCNCGLRAGSFKTYAVRYAASRADDAECVPRRHGAVVGRGDARVCPTTG